MKKNKTCQSCGMPMKKDPKNGSTNTDGSINLTYCSYCFENGDFTQKDISAEDMQKFVKQKLKEIGFPGFIARIFTKGIPRLERWKNK